MKNVLIFIYTLYHNYGLFLYQWIALCLICFWQFIYNIIDMNEIFIKARKLCWLDKQYLQDDIEKNQNNSTLYALNWHVIYMRGQTYFMNQYCGEIQLCIDYKTYF